MSDHGWMGIFWMSLKMWVGKIGNEKTIKILLPYHPWDIYLLFPNYVLQITVLFEWLAMAERNSKHLQRFKWIVKFVFKKFEHKWRKNVFSRSFFLQTCTYMTCAKCTSTHLLQFLRKRVGVVSHHIFNCPK